MQVYGIVTRCSLVRPKLVKSVHYCANTGMTMTREYRDVTALTGLPTGGQAHGSALVWAVCVIFLPAFVACVIPARPCLAGSAHHHGGLDGHLAGRQQRK